MARRPDADLSLDLDNQWSYLKTRGDCSWSTFPSYLPRVVPLILETLEQLNLVITVFVVGQDVELPEHQRPLADIVAAGHEIGNHSFHHEPWLQRYSPEALRVEFDRAEQALRRITSAPLRGFRAPGYSLSGEVLNVLCERGYQYDCSTLPTYLGPAARAYYLLKTSVSQNVASRQAAQERKELFGSFSDGFRSLKPYMWATDHGEILELPVSTIPIMRTPFHFSYLHYLSQFSSKLASCYFAMALQMCKWTRTAPSLLLHPLDFLGADEVPQLSFFPGMQLSGKRKRAFVLRSLQRYARKFHVLPMHQRAENLLATDSHPLRRLTRLPPSPGPDHRA